MTVTKTKTEKHSIEWATPKALYDKINAAFNFTLDPCATAENAKCAKYYTKEDNGLTKFWTNEVVFMNPPYRKELPFWMAKAQKESFKNEAIVVCLIVPRTDTKWWHETCCYAKEIRFLKGRVRFENPGNPVNSPQDPSCLVVFTPKDSFGEPTAATFWDWKNQDYAEVFVR